MKLSDLSGNRYTLESILQQYNGDFELILRPLIVGDILPQKLVVVFSVDYNSTFKEKVPHLSIEKEVEEVIKRKLLESIE